MNGLPQNLSLRSWYAQECDSCGVAGRLMLSLHSAMEEPIDGDLWKQYLQEDQLMSSGTGVPCLHWRVLMRKIEQVPCLVNQIMVKNICSKRKVGNWTLHFLLLELLALRRRRFDQVGSGTWYIPRPSLPGFYISYQPATLSLLSDQLWLRDWKGRRHQDDSVMNTVIMTDEERQQLMWDESLELKQRSI